MENAGDYVNVATDDTHHRNDIRRRFMEFLLGWSEHASAPGGAPDSQTESGASGTPLVFPYKDQVQALAGAEGGGTIYVNFQHLKWYDADLAEHIQLDWLKLEPTLRQALHSFVNRIDPSLARSEDQTDRDFYIAWDGIDRVDRLRDLRSAKVGSLLCWKGTVTRTTEVRPELFMATFKCGHCGALTRNVEQQFVYTTPVMCPVPTCSNKSMWTLVKEESTFVDWQRAKVQENADEIPAGSLPRSMDVIIRHEQVENVRPGDKAVFTGSLIVMPDMAAFTAPGERTLLQTKGRGAPVGKGVSGTGVTGARELHYKLAFLANNTQVFDVKAAMVDARTDDETTPEDVALMLGPQVMEEVQRMRRDPEIYSKLANSIAPGVYGHADIKRAVLLMLVGGVHKVTAEGIRLRGDINVAIVGDPSTAKSQMLKYVSAFLPRAVYTGGKSSSAAGLTATVVREAETREHAIEAGALMLADNGICCIDEFDKMDIKDQVAIHEAMEQQTISIAKAGVQATLNARAAILAAANPLGGRYDRAKPLKYNVNLSPAILSRFDLLHVMVDEVNASVDEAIAHHILKTHRGLAEEDQQGYSTLQLQRYIRYARALKPKMTATARVKLVEAFKALRASDAIPGGGSVYRITVRQLEALIRLSEALARVHHRMQVLPGDVAEAQRMIRASVHSAGDASVVIQLPQLGEGADDVARVWLDDAPPDAHMQEGPGGAGDTGGAADADAEDEDEEGRGQDGPPPRVRQRLGSTAGAARRPPVAAAHDEPGGAEEEGGGEAQAGAQAAGAAAARPAGTQPVRISRQRWVYMHNHVLAVLRAAEEGDMPAAVKEVPTANETLRGLTQHDIIKWHVRQELEKGKLEGQEGVVSEIQLMQKVINVMLSRDGSLVEAVAPERLPQESREEYVVRKERERVLAINPNYCMD